MSAWEFDYIAEVQGAKINPMDVQKFKEVSDSWYSSIEALAVC